MLKRRHRQEPGEKYELIRAEDPGQRAPHSTEDVAPAAVVLDDLWRAGRRVDMASPAARRWKNL